MRGKRGKDTVKGNKFGRIFLVVFIVGTIIEFCGAMLMRPALEANGGVPWRTDLTALGYVGFLLIGIIYAFSFTFIFLQGYRGHGPVEGVRFGIWATLLASAAPAGKTESGRAARLAAKFSPAARVQARPARVPPAAAARTPRPPRGSARVRRGNRNNSTPAAPARARAFARA